MREYPQRPKTMAHDNPVFFVTSTNDLTLNGLDGQRSARGEGDVPSADLYPSTENTVSKESSEKMPCKWRWYWLVNTVVVLAIFGLLLLLEFDVFKFRPFGFYCNDPRISHKWTEDTVRFSYVLVITFLVPLTGLCLVETLFKADRKERLKGLRQAGVWYGYYLFGLLLVTFVTEAGKCIVSEPRPHFIDTCKPDNIENCTGFITEYKCTNTKTHSAKDSYRSFPSGHSSMALYMSVFMMKRIPLNEYLIVPILDCLLVLWALTCALTRITDHRHHWWDVLAGSLIGTGVALYTTLVLCYYFDDEYGEDRLSTSSSYGRRSIDKELREVRTR